LFVIFLKLILNFPKNTFSYINKKKFFSGDSKITKKLQRIIKGRKIHFETIKSNITILETKQNKKIKNKDNKIFKNSH